MCNNLPYVVKIRPIRPAGCNSHTLNGLHGTDSLQQSVPRTEFSRPGSKNATNLDARCCWLGAHTGSCLPVQLFTEPGEVIRIRPSLGGSSPPPGRRLRLPEFAVLCSSSRGVFTRYWHLFGRWNDPVADLSESSPSFLGSQRVTISHSPEMIPASRITPVAGLVQTAIKDRYQTSATQATSPEH